MNQNKRKSIRELLAELNDDYMPETFGEAVAMFMPCVLLFGSIGLGAWLGGWYWIIPMLGVPASLCGMWRVGGWE